MLKDFKLDYYRMTGEEFKFDFNCLIKTTIKHNLKYMFIYRLSKNSNIKIIQKIYRVRLYFLGRKYGIEVLPTTQIGKGLYMGHPYNITINQNAMIGDNVNIMKGVTIGAENRGDRVGCPTIGNRVYLGINSTIVGNVKIGNNVLVSPNTFVNRDIPDNSIVIGNPCKIIYRENATEGYVNFLV